MLPDSAHPRHAAGQAGDMDDPVRVAAVRRLVSALQGTTRQDTTGHDTAGHDTTAHGTTAHGTTGLDRLTRLAALLLDVPHVQVSLIGEEQVVVSRHGDPQPEMSRGPADDSLCAVTLRAGRALRVVDAPADGRVRGLPPVRSGEVRSYVGLPLRDESGRVLGALCAYDSVPRAWSDEQVDVLGELAASVVAELELRALGREASGTAARLDLALHAAETGSFDLDTGTGALRCDDRFVRLFGYDRASFVEHLDSLQARLHPEDLQRAGDALATAVRTQGELSLEHRIVLRGGEVRWVEVRGRVMPGGGRRASPRLVGVAHDATELREARDRLARTLETMNDAFYALDADWRFTYVNRQAERLLRRTREELLGASLWEEFPATRDSAFSQGYERAVATGRPVVFEAAYAPLGGWYELNASPGPEGLSVYFKDITERKDIEREREQAVVERERAYAEANAASTRLALLADASVRLAQSLEPRQVLERLSELVVPALGEWVVVALSAETAAQLHGQDAVADTEQVHVVHVAHADPARQPALVAAVTAVPVHTSDPVGAGAVVRTGRASELPEPAAAAPGAGTGPADPGPGPVLTLPLASRGRVLGALTVAAQTGAPVDRELLADVAGRAAVALHNALLFGAERRTGITLQRSLMPRDVPAVPGLLTAARYLPGTTGAFVGGDWYQGVRVGDGLVLAMGDVMGHGMRSAARMGQLRAIIGALALEGHGPAQLLRRLAGSVDVLLDLELATVLVASYDPASCRLTVASAGHPPPLLARRDGTPAFVDVEPGPPLGSFPFPYVDVTVDLAPGDTLVLYTDGLVENRQESLDVGLERLRSALAQPGLPPEAVCDHLLDRLGRTGGGDDDVAVLVLTLSGEGVPRAAGPAAAPRP